MDAVLLQALEALGDRGRGQPDAAAQLGERQPRVLLQLGDEQKAIGRIESDRDS